VMVVSHAVVNSLVYAGVSAMSAVSAGGATTVKPSVDEHSMSRTRSQAERWKSVSRIGPAVANRG
jgi:hypothetical protein